METYELVVSQGNRPWLNTVLASGFFCLAAFFLLHNLELVWNEPQNEAHWRQSAGSLWVIAASFTLGVSLAVIKTVKVDLDTRLLLTVYEVGPFKKTIKTTVPEFEYVSVFHDRENYFVKLWYPVNKHYTMFAFEQKDAAMSLATQTAQKLGIGLLDASSRGNSQWIEVK